MNEAVSSPAILQIYFFKGNFFVWTAKWIYYKNLYFLFLISKTFHSEDQFVKNNILGLFVQCLQWMPGQFQCDNFLRPIFSMSALSIFEQALGIISTILSRVQINFFKI